MKNATCFPIFGILGLIFVTLKLCDVIAWSWWWITAPFWMPLAIALVVALIWALVVAFVSRRF